MKLLRKKEGFTLVEIMIVVAIIALLAAIAIPNLLRARLASNDALAQSTLRTLSTASETFATANNGNYATAESDLTGATPPYLNEAYCDQVLSGYTFTCPTMSSSAYSFVATPLSAGSSGTTIYTITTGGVLTP